MDVWRSLCVHTVSMWYRYLCSPPAPVPFSQRKDWETWPFRYICLLITAQLHRPERFYLQFIISCLIVLLWLQFNTFTYKAKMHSSVWSGTLTPLNNIKLGHFTQTVQWFRYKLAVWENVIESKYWSQTLECRWKASYFKGN